MNVTFTALVVHLLKYQNELNQAGLHFRFEDSPNLYRDRIVITTGNSFSPSYCTITSHLWDNSKEMTLNMAHSRKYHFRINPIDHRPHIVFYNNEMHVDPTEMPSDLKALGEYVLKIILNLDDRIKNEKLLLIHHNLNGY
jgi:hypothetical protein